MATVTTKGHINLYIGGTSGPENPHNWHISNSTFTDNANWLHVKEFELTFEHEITPDEIIKHRVSGLRSERVSIVEKFAQELAAVDQQIAQLTAIENSHA